jgi:SHS2 domain-containing protein
MERYTILPHAADGKFRAFGATLEEAFANAALATASFMWEWETVPRDRAESIDLRGRDTEQLLYRFLEEILYLFETRRFVLAAVEGLVLEPAPEGRRLRAVLRGAVLGPGIGLHGEVKAITYNAMRIEEGCGGWMAQVVVDL